MTTTPARTWRERLLSRLPDLGLLAALAVLLGLCAQGGLAWPLLGVGWVPAVLLLQRHAGWRATGLAAWAVAVVYTAAAFSWFGVAIGQYTQIGAGWGLALLLLLAPVFQPQILAYALVRQAVQRHHGAGVAALAAAGAWVACEWAWPKMLGDSLGHGLYPSLWLRQAADLGGVAGLSLLALGLNEALAAAWQRRRAGARAWGFPLAVAGAIPLLLAIYGAATLAGRPAEADQPQLRIGLVQANITDLEARRRAQGAYAVVREVLDTHYAMSHDAVERQRADAVLWSETVYPTTFAQPKSEAGAELDREIVSIVNAAGVPFVFGTYDRDREGEYNAAAFVEPGRGLLGFYRKTRPFPLTEYVPPWLDGPTLRGLLPWLGTWQPGNGPRPLPLRLRDGREVPVQALICRDDVDPSLAIAAARLGVQALLTMSNDSWFSRVPQGAELHQAVAAFRSIETRLPQFRVTTNGFSGLIDATGTVRAGTGMNERALVVGSLPVPQPVPTLMVRWGDWVGPTALAGLLLLAAGPLLRRLVRPVTPATAGAMTAAGVKVAVLPTWAWGLTLALRTLARVAVLVLAAAWLTDEAFRANSWGQLRAFVAAVVLPEAVALCLLAAFGARLRWGSREGAAAEPRLQLSRGTHQLERPLSDLAGMTRWRWPLPLSGQTLHWRAGPAWHLAGQGAAAALDAEPALNLAPAQAPFEAARAAWPPGGLASPALRFALLPLGLAIPAFLLHQHIAYGAWLGEFHSYGLRAYTLAFALWWAAWIWGVTAFAATLRVGIEGAAWLTAHLRPAWAQPARLALERLGLLALFGGLPVWLGLRLAGL
ncbi:apolipoprotein N-acyltransferase [Inhella gelatinilytica]|uniref:Apolipoprotein N-acyltransferase n=1 Tax=Inhella gelatinilytica TaxID=2795030 RepID=A0A931IX16_9BURK|nr:apolipoprotein N-acyltransferase [Inhella gelatinilytica]MBH9552223.1 apolipoprotein N-acyltransferase [Inhella gelatinilytica]